MAINKVEYGDQTLMDLTEDTVTEDKVLEGETFHDKSGNLRTGSLVIPVQDVEVNGESVVDAEGIAEVVVPVSGDVSTTDFFESYTGGKVKSLQVELSPIQDLHGYDSPWVGGSGYNKWDEEWEIGSIKPDTGATEVHNGRIRSKNFVSVTANTTYYFKCPSTSACRIAYYDSDNQYLSGSWSLIPNTTFTTPSDCAYIKFSPNNDYGTTYSNNIAINYPSTVTTYSPYENICPISGHTKVKVGNDGKNRLPLSLATIKSLNTSGTWSGNIYSVNGGTFEVLDNENKIIGIKVNGLFTANTFLNIAKNVQINDGDILNGCPVNGSTSTYSIEVYNSDLLSWYGRDVGNGYTFSGSHSDGNFFIGMRNGYNASNLVFYPMLRLASDTDPTFALYNGYQVTVNLGGTYYWLRGDVVSGKWYVIGQSVDMSTMTFVAGGGGYFSSSDIRTVVKLPSGANEKPNTYCSCFEVMSYNKASSSSNALTIIHSGASASNQGKVWVWCSEASTVEEFNAVINGQTLCYELATPIPLDLTPQQILAIIGENNFSAPLENQEIIEIVARNIAEFNEVIDDEQISEDFTYSSEKIEDRLEDFVDKDAIEEKSATTEFETINGGLLSECIIELVPVQSGSGDPSPDNVRPISGHTEVDLLTEGKNLLENVETVTSHSSVSFTKNSDGSVYAKGTVGQNIGYYVFTNETNSLSLNNVTRFKAGQVVRGTTGSGRTLSVRYSDGVYGSIPANTAYTLPKDVACVYVQFKAGTTVDELITPMIWSNVEDTDSTFEPYFGHLYQVQIGSTVYGGYVDLVSGVMTVDKMRETITSVSAIWQSGGYSFRAFVSQAHTQPTSGSSVDVFGICNRFSQVSANQAYQSSKDFSFSIDRDATRVSLCFDASVTTVELANQYLAQNPVQICYELATPQTIQLTPQQIEALVGQNNLSTPLDGQSIETNGVEYKELFTFADVKEIVDLRVPISMLGTDESGRTTASQSYASGDYFYKDGYMCKALTSISAGATLTLNTNYSQGTLADILKAIENA